MPIFIIIFVLIILAQPSVSTNPLTVDEMLMYPGKEKCGHVLVTRFEALRPIDPSLVITVFEGVICDGERISIT